MRLAVWRPLAAVLIVVIALTLGFGLPEPDAGTRYRCGGAGRRVSAVLGWAYFAAWSCSFYPQCLLNYQRKSVVGLSFDFAYLNLCGFVCYSCFNLALLYSPPIRDAYAARHHGQPPAVTASDVAFSLHAAALSSVVVAQLWLYPGGGQRVSAPCRVFFALLGAALAVGTPLVAARACADCTWLNLLYAISYVKLGITLTKYVPQVVLNRRRRSTAGWNIDNVVLDFTGGTLSLGQLLMDAACRDDWSAVSGDPVKFGLGFASMFFDCIFLVQHFVLYRPARGEVTTPALAAHVNGRLHAAPAGEGDGAAAAPVAAGGGVDAHGLASSVEHERRAPLLEKA